MQWPPTRPGRNGRKFHLVPAACSTASVSMPILLKMIASSLISAMLRSRWVFSITLAASATLMLGRLMGAGDNDLFVELVDQFGDFRRGAGGDLS